MAGVEADGQLRLNGPRRWPSNQRGFTGDRDDINRAHYARDYADSMLIMITIRKGETTNWTPLLSNDMFVLTY